MAATAFILIIFSSLIYVLIRGNRNSRRSRILEASKHSKAAREAYENQKKLKELKMSQIDGMDGHSFEHFIADLLRARGFRNVVVTVGSGDFGVDITCEKDEARYAVQCKRYAQPVSRRAISDAVAGKSHYRCTSAMVITNSYFTPKAVEFSRSAKCELIDRDKLKEWIFEAYGTTPIQDTEEYGSSYNSNTPIEESATLISEAPIELGTSITQILLPTPESAKSIALKKARDEYPDDFTMQEYIYNEQIQDYNDLHNLIKRIGRTKALEPVIKRILFEYSDDFSMQRHEINEQVEAESKLKQIASYIEKSPELKRTFSNIRQEYPDDFSMQYYEMEQQISSFRKINSLSQSPLSNR